MDKIKVTELEGEKIVEAYIQGHSTGCDGKNQLVLKMDSGRVFHVTGSYGGYTGKSCDEYPEFVTVEEMDAHP